MASDLDPSASTIRIATRAALLVVPLVLAAIGAPSIVKMFRPQVAPGAPVPSGLGGLAVPGAQGAPEEKPRPPDGPTPEQIERSKDAQVALGKAQRGWESVSVITPPEARVGEDGWPSLPFDGFAVSVETVPEGAKVFAGGEPLGEAPLMASVACAPGAELKLRLEKPPLPSREVAVRCRANTLVKVAVRLDRSPAASPPPRSSR